jgi:methyl-accepting chemotaxis protein
VFASGIGSMMLLHNSVDMRRPVALAMAIIGGAPLLVAGLAVLMLAHSLGLGLAMMIAGLCFGAGAGALGWRGADSVVQPWNELAVGWDAHVRGEGSEIVTPYQDAQGALGEMARALAGSRKYIVDQNARKAEAVERRRVQNEERTRQEEQIAAQAREQASVVESLASGLALAADGDLEFRIRSDFPASYRKLKDDFNSAMGKLQEAMKSIAASALSVRAGANEISQAADDLSRRTEHQAASLEETAAALDQITATVRKTAEGAKEVSTAVVAAKADAERSGQIVHDAVGAMSGIARSAQEISQIISVIDEIAFQTNLLALNAGVEAARAGEAGRGFAVVASEVRALAQRSAAAAKEIKALISTSTTQVSAGVQLVGNAGQALERILTKVGDISTLMTGIAASTKEQAISLHEVNSSIGQMDHVTQQNAAMVEESTAASFALVSEAQQLTEMIARFQIGAVAQPPPRRAPVPERAARVRRPAIVRGGRGAATARKIEVDEDESWEEF